MTMPIITGPRLIPRSVSAWKVPIVGPGEPPRSRAQAIKAGLYGLTENRQLSESNSKPPFIPVHRTGFSGCLNKEGGKGIEKILQRYLIVLTAHNYKL